jgi:Flp pilus assembly protein CpaB
VDVILTVKTSTEGENGGNQIAKTILQNALVLSIDQSVAHPVAGDDGSSSPPAEDGTSNAEASSVTLAVSPVHGEVLTAAETCGKNFNGRLALALRPFGESDLVGTRAQWADDGAPPGCAALLGLESLQ